MVALPLPQVFEMRPRLLGLAPDQQEARAQLSRLFHVYLRSLTWEVPSKNVARTAARRRGVFANLFTQVLALGATAGEFPAQPDRLWEWASAEADRHFERLEAKAAQALSKRGLIALRGAFSSYKGLLDRLIEESRDGGVTEETQRLLLEATDRLTDFQVAMTALSTSLSGQIEGRPENLEALAHLADRAMGDVEDIFLAAGLGPDKPRGAPIPLEEVLKELEL